MEDKKKQTVSARSILAEYIRRLPDDELLTMLNLSRTCLMLQLEKYNEMERVSLRQFNEAKKALTRDELSEGELDPSE